MLATVIGRFLFAINTASPSISRYAIADNGSLTRIGSTTFSDPVGLAPVDARLAPDGRTPWDFAAGVRCEEWMTPQFSRS
jgi:hypothetical protein